MLIMLGMLGVFYAVVIFILYTTQQKTSPTFDEYSVGGRSYGPWYVAMSYVNSWWPGSVFIAFLASGRWNVMVRTRPSSTMSIIRIALRR